MTGPFVLDLDIEFGDEDGRVRTGVVTHTWMGGRRAVVRTSDGDVMTIRDDQIDRPAATTTVTVDLDEAERIALAVMSGERVFESATGQAVKLAAAVLMLRGRAAA